MKRYEIQKFGIEQLSLVETGRPVPSAHEVLIRVRACSVNYRDLMMVEGSYNPRLKLPRVPFSDGAGEVVEVGEAVTRFKPGDRVAGTFMQAWIDGDLSLEQSRTAMGGPVDGMLSEYVALSEEGVVAIPSHLSFEEASTLPCAALTAWNALVTTGNLEPGETVLLLGTGGVSIFALQFAKMCAARVIITSSSDEKLARAKELGADELINYTTTPEWDRRARELTGGRGVDHVVEVGGAGTLSRSLNAVRMSGSVYVIGVLGGSTGDLSPVPILQKNLRVRGIFVGSRAMFEAMNRAIEQKELRPVIDRTFAFDDARDALRHMKSAAHFGKIVVSVD